MEHLTIIQRPTKLLLAISHWQNSVTDQNVTTVRGKYLKGGNIGKFGEFMAIRQIFTLQMLSFTYTIQIACKSKFANILPFKS